MKVSTKNPILFLSLIGLLLFFYTCKKNEELIAIPTVSTFEALIIDMNTVIVSGSISSDGGAKISERGICWSTEHSPEISGNKVIAGTGSGDFSGLIEELNSNIPYFFRTYAINRKGVSYGEEVTLTLWLNKPDEPITDIDGNIYSTVKIGTQIWMSENLRVTHYQTEEPIPYISLTDDTQWLATNLGAYCSYNDENENIITYGLLYNWHAITDQRNLCPEGWRIPTKEDWEILVDYLKGNNFAGAKLKKHEGWAESEYSATTAESGFNALPAGLRTMNLNNPTHSTFYGQKTGGYWWTSDEYGSSYPELGYYYSLWFDWDAVNSGYNITKNCGLSLRCIKK